MWFSGRLQRNFYRQAINNFASFERNDNNNSDNIDWSELDRRAGQDRRSDGKDRHRKFEYRFSKDRRKTKRIFVRV